MVGREHLRPLAEQLGATGNDLLGLAIGILHVRHRAGQREAEKTTGREAEDFLHVAGSEMLIHAGLFQSEERFDPEQGRAGETRLAEVGPDLIEPEKAIRQIDAAALHLRDAKVGTEEQSGGTEDFQDGLEGLGFADG